VLLAPHVISSVSADARPAAPRCHTASYDVASNVCGALGPADCTCSTTGFDYLGAWNYDHTGAECTAGAYTRPLFQLNISTFGRILWVASLCQ